MDIPFTEKWRKHHAAPSGGVIAAAGIDELLSECDLLRDRASDGGVELDCSPGSLDALDQLSPRWRDDPEETPQLGNDAGLYLGTVMVRSVPGAAWQIRKDGQPVVRLASGRDVDVAEIGRQWAASGTPELSQSHAEAAED